MLANLFYRNRRLTALAVALLTLSGIGALGALGRAEDPTLARRYGTVKTFFPGASALRVESLVTEKLEAALLELHEVINIDSVSREGASIIVIEFGAEYGYDEVDAVWSKVRDRIGAVPLPRGATPPEVEDETTTAATLVVSFTWQAEQPQLDIATRLAEELQNRLRNLPDTEATRLFGEAAEEIRVTVDPLELASRNLTPADVALALRRADAKSPAGQLRGDSTDLLIEVAGELTSVERVRSVPLRQDRSGHLVRVGEVADVAKTVQEPPQSLAFVRGRPAVVLSATMSPDRRVDLWAESARALLAEFEREVPAGIELEILFDQSVFTGERLATLAVNLGIAAAIVLGVLFFLMGAKAALVVGAALPLTLAMVLAEFGLIDMPLHQTSVTGLIIALGLLIDNAIVVVDEYASRRKRGLAPAHAVAAAVRHLFVPLLASTLTTVLAFMPIVLASGPMSEFVGPIAIGVILAVLSSFLLSMTVIPALAGYLLPDPQRSRSHWWSTGWSSPRLTALYARSLDLVLRRPGVGVSIALVLPLLGFAASRTLVEQFFPPNDRNQFQIQMTLPAQASLAETRDAALRAREIVESHGQVHSSHWFVGGGAPRVFYTMLKGEDRNSSYANAFVTTDSAEATERLLPALQRELADALPDARIVALPFEQGPPVDAPIEVRIVGPDLGVLRDLGEQVRAVLGRSLAVTYTNAELAGGNPKILLRTDEEEARLAGLRLVDISDQLAAQLEGATGGSVLEANQELPVRVRIRDDARGDLGGIAGHYVLPAARAAEGPERAVPGVPLSAVSRVDLVPELAAITRRNGERINTVQAYLEPYALIASSLNDFRARLAESELSLPPGYRFELGGEDEERAEAVARLAAFAAPLFVLMAGTIVLSFNSYRMALIIGAVAILSVGLAFGGVWLFGYPMGFLAIVGTMGLVGLAINGGIVVLSALRADPAARAGDMERARDVVIGATRHIVGTTLTTIGGFLPLIYLGGRFWPPLATAIAGGVGGSAILALYLVPSLFAWSTRRQPEPAPAPGRLRWPGRLAQAAE